MPDFELGKLRHFQCITKHIHHISTIKFHKTNIASIIESVRIIGLLERFQHFINESF